VQIITMSGLAMNKSVAMSIKEAVQACVAKPFAASELLEPLAQTCIRNIGIESDRHLCPQQLKPYP
jgi:hypothetical protein